MTKSEARAEVCWALGLHPAASHEQRDVAAVLRLAADAEAIGEVGLDYSARSLMPRERQRRILGLLLGDEQVKRRLVSIHSVQATADVLASLAEHPVPGAVLHWFLGDSRCVERAIDLDVFFSVNEAMIQSDRGRHVLESLPPNRVVLETDAPYGGRRGRPNVPGDLQPVVRGLARLWDRDLDLVKSMVSRNQATLLARLEISPVGLRPACANGDPGGTGP
jgi:TatD DNase family protein